MSNNVNIPNETINKIYDDVVHPSATEVGKLISRIPRAINAALSPLDQWIAKRENNIEKTKKLLEENLQNVDPDKIVMPEPYVGIPAIQALSYSMDSNELRKMYANLLSKAIYSDTKNSVHPSFVEIIKNLSPLDCRIFETIMSSKYKEIGSYEMRVGKIGESSYHILYPYITEITLSDPYTIASSIDNLTRNKLVEPKDFHFDDDDMYLPIRNTPFYQFLVNQYSSNPENQELRPCESSIKSTSFGRIFYDICCQPI